MSLSHATKNVFLALFQEPSGCNMVTQSTAQINHRYFWWQSKTGCRKAQRLHSECCWLHSTHSADMSSACCPFQHFWTVRFRFLCSSVQLWQVRQAPEKLFHSVRSHFSPSLEAALTCMWLGTAHWLLSSSASCRCPHPRTRTAAAFGPTFCAARPCPAQENQTRRKGCLLILFICSASFYSWMSSFTQLMTWGKESCAGTAEGCPENPGEQKERTSS